MYILTKISFPPTRQRCRHDRCDCHMQPFWVLPRHPPGKTTMSRMRPMTRHRGIAGILSICFFGKEWDANGDNYLVIYTKYTISHSIVIIYLLVFHISMESHHV